MTDVKKTTDTAVHDAGQTIRDQAAVDAKGPVAGELLKDDDGIKAALTASAITDLGRIEEVRAVLARAYDNYRQGVDQALKRLNGFVGGSAHPEVQKTAKAVADAYDLKLDPHGLKQPPAPKGASPFAK